MNKDLSNHKRQKDLYLGGHTVIKPKSGKSGFTVWLLSFFTTLVSAFLFASGNSPLNWLVSYMESINSSTSSADRPSRSTDADANPSQTNVNELPTIDWANKAKPSKPKPVYDPAVAMSKRVWYYPNYNLPHLNTDDYKKVVGDLARIQDKLMIDRSKAKILPNVVIGYGEWQKKECNEALPTLGMYASGGPCVGNITVNFTANNVFYEHPIEVMTTLAHEWGHHIVNISGQNISRITNELVSDCFAGLYLAYLDDFGLVSESEIKSTIRMMAQIGNFDGFEHGTPKQRVNGLIAGAFYGSDPRNQENAAAWNTYCKELDSIIDLSKGLS